MEQRLIKRAQKGNHTAYAQLFSRYESEIYKLAYVYVKNPDDALDLVQEVAYRSYKFIHTLKEAKYYKTWLIRILMNSASDFLKKRPVYEELQSDLYIEPTDQDIDVKITLDGVMRHLTKEEKDIILLKYYEDYTFEQIAKVLDVRLGTTKTICYRALKKLKIALEKEGISYEQFKG